MSTCPTRKNLWKFRLLVVVFIVSFLLLALSGRAGPGPKYPWPMLLIALFYSLSTLGYVIARNTKGHEAPAERKHCFARGYSLVEWPAVVICIIGQFSWGWYVLLGVLCHGVYRSLREPPNLKNSYERLLRASWVFEMVFIVYVVSSKSFFWR